jgi:hypothetical protein
MLRRIARRAVLAALVALAGGCGTTTTTPTPTPVQTTDTFSGTLTPANSVVHSFVTLTGGSVKATLTSIGPDPTQTIGFSLGTFNSTTGVCTVVFDNTAALQTTAVFNATASTIGFYCVRVYDNGNVKTLTDAGTVSDANPFTYKVTVVHP